jgi:hypothetical protein
MPSIVQFFHPGGEHGYDCRRNGKYYKEWNGGNHKRKYIISKGNYIENNSLHEGRLMFWGEWEPPSLVEFLPPSIKKLPYEVYPEYLHYPFLPPMKQIPVYQRQMCQNTDPFVFGDKFKYSICLQDSFTGLRNLEDGSLILFGHV